MHIRCPNCSHPIELVDDVNLDSVSCPSCGSRFSLLSADEETTTQTVLQRVPSLAHFEMIQIVGTGQFGKVWKARDADLDRLVAIKVPYHEHMTEHDAALFLREAQAAARLNHTKYCHRPRSGPRGRRGLHCQPVHQWRNVASEDEAEAARY